MNSLAIPPRIWWQKNWLAPTPLLFSAAGGSGKTTVTQAILTALGTDKRYLDEPPEKPLRVLMWQCEETKDDIWRRQAEINRYLGVTMADLALVNMVPRLGLDNTLLALPYGQPSFTPLLEYLREQVNDLEIDVLALDNLAQIFGGDERNRHQATYFVNGIAGLVRDRPFAPMLLGHTARSEGSEFSGSAAWENAVRMRWYLGPTLPDQKPSDSDDVEDTDVVYLAKRKANYAAKDWRRFKFQNGIFVPDQPADCQRFDQAFRNEAAEQVVLAAIPKLIAAGITPSDKAQSGDYLPKQVIALRHNQSHTKDELAKAMHRLMGNGQLRREAIGKYSNRNPKFGLVVQ